MGIVNMLNTMMNTAYQLMLDTVFYIMAIAVLAGAVSALFSEFGVVAVINKILSPLMKPIYGLPGASVVGIVATYLSTHVAMMDSLKCSELTSKAILSHTIGGLCAGISAHLFYVLFSLIG